MKYLKLISKNIGIMSLIIIVFTFIFTLLNYFNLISGNVMAVLQIIITIIALFIGGFLTGKNSQSKGWLEGLKIGIIFSILLLIINLIFIKNFEIKNTLYYLIMIGCSIFGSMIGISKKELTQ